MCVEFVSPGEPLNISWRGINAGRMPPPPLPTWSALQLEAHYPSLNLILCTNWASKAAIKSPVMRYDNRKWWIEYLSLGFIMKWHSFPNPCIFIGHFPLNIIIKKEKKKRKRRKPSSFTLLGFIHSIWFDISCFCALAIRTQHCSILASSFAFHSERCVQKKSAPWDKHVYGDCGLAAPAAGGPLLPNEHRNLLLSQRCFSPDN